MLLDYRQQEMDRQTDDGSANRRRAGLTI